MIRAACGPKTLQAAQVDIVSSVFFFFSSRRRHTRFDCDWSSDVCSSDLEIEEGYSVGATTLWENHPMWEKIDEALKPFRTAPRGARMIGYAGPPTRSEERRVGKECRSRWSPYH